VASNQDHFGNSWKSFLLYPHLIMIIGWGLLHIVSDIIFPSGSPNISSFVMWSCEDEGYDILLVISFFCLGQSYILIKKNIIFPEEIVFL